MISLYESYLTSYKITTDNLSYIFLTHNFRYHLGVTPSLLYGCIIIDAPIFIFNVIVYFILNIYYVF